MRVRRRPEAPRSGASPGRSSPGGSGRPRARSPTRSTSACAAARPSKSFFPTFIDSSKYSAFIAHVPSWPEHFSTIVTAAPVAARRSRDLKPMFCTLRWHGQVVRDRLRRLREVEREKALRLQLGEELEEVARVLRDERRVRRVGRSAPFGEPRVLLLDHERAGRARRHDRVALVDPALHRGDERPARLVRARDVADVEERHPAAPRVRDRHLDAGSSRGPRRRPARSPAGSTRRSTSERRRPSRRAPRVLTGASRVSNHAVNVRHAKRGRSFFAETPSVFSSAQRARGSVFTKFATGAIGRASRPSASGFESSRSRSGSPVSFIRTCRDSRTRCGTSTAQRCGGMYGQCGRQSLHS